LGFAEGFRGLRFGQKITAVADVQRLRHNNVLAVREDPMPSGDWAFGRISRFYFDV
jgi:hypothetical protein